MTCKALNSSDISSQVGQADLQTLAEFARVRIPVAAHDDATQRGEPEPDDP